MAIEVRKHFMNEHESKYRPVSWAVDNVGLGATLLTTTGEPRYERYVVLSLLLLLIKAENVINAVGVPNTMMMMPRRIVGHQQRR